MVIMGLAVRLVVAAKFTALYYSCMISGYARCSRNDAWLYERSAHGDGGKDSVLHPGEDTE